MNILPSKIGQIKYECFDVDQGLANCALKKQMVNTLGITVQKVKSRISIDSHLLYSFCHNSSILLLQYEGR